MKDDERSRRIVRAIGDFSARQRRQGSPDGRITRGPMASQPPPEPKPKAKSKSRAHDELVAAILLWLRTEYKQNWFGWDNRATHKVYDKNTGRSFYVPAGKKGASDILGVLFGFFVAIEVKTGRAELTYQQDTFRMRTTTAGGLYLEARSLTTTRQEVQSWLTTKLGR